MPRNTLAKLTPTLVAEMRTTAHLDPDVSMYDFALRYGVSRQAIARALYGFTYKKCAVKPISQWRRTKSRQQHPLYIARGERRKEVRAHLPSCSNCTFLRTQYNGVFESRCLAAPQKANVKAFPFKHTKCKKFSPRTQATYL
jgi:hypothetical protein